MYSSGNNSISGNNVGINKSSPSGILHLYGEGIPSMGGGFTYTPLLRIQGASDPNNSPTHQHYWDFQMDGTSSLTFWNHTDNNTATKSLSLNYSSVKIFTKLLIGDFSEYGEGFTPDGTQGYYLSLGLKQLGTSGAWQGSGVTMFTSSTGNFQIMANSSGVVNGSTDMTYKVKLQVNESGVSINTTNLPAGYSFAVGGDAIFEKVVVKAIANWPDFVFRKNYDLISLNNLKGFIVENGHLPGVPSSEEVNNGYKEADISILNLEGRVIWNGNAKYISASQIRQVVDVSRFMPGVYIVSIDVEDNNYRSKFVKK